ncbi:MAG: EamA family transporter RarD [Leucobacter sp.]
MPRSHTGHAGSPGSGLGTLLSVSSSIAFGGVYFLTPLLFPVAAESLWALRNIITLPLIALALVAIRQWYTVTEIAARIRHRPLLLLGITACGAIIAAQLWVFGWAPMHGRGMQVALGYFLLPLVLVVIGRFLYRDRLLWWHWLAAGVASVGVVYELFRVGGVSWETLIVAVGYPIYFVLRRALGTAHLGGMLWEFLLLTPVAAVLLTMEIVGGSATAANPNLWWAAPIYAAGAGVALMLYLGASRLLTLSLFGLLGYLEPALLTVASMLNGERIPAEEWGLYGAVWLAVLVLVGGGIAQLLQRRSPLSGRREPR